jgi:hypothetical protein
VVIAGDLLDIRSAVPLSAQAAAVSAQIGRIGERGVLLAASGNHDLDERDAANEKFAAWLQRVRSPGLHVDGESLLIDATLFRICPWWDGPGDASNSRSVWSLMRPETSSAGYGSTTRRRVGRRYRGTGGANSATTTWPAGSPARFRPDLVLSGHIHQAPFVDAGGWADRIGDTWVFNAGQQPGPVPTHIVIDLTASQATWLGATDRETVALGVN